MESEKRRRKNKKKSPKRKNRRRSPPFRWIYYFPFFSSRSVSRPSAAVCVRVRVRVRVLGGSPWLVNRKEWSQYYTYCSTYIQTRRIVEETSTRLLRLRYAARSSPKQHYCYCYYYHHRDHSIVNEAGRRKNIIR